MDRLARLAVIRGMFHRQRLVTRDDLAQELDCSIPTAKRVIREARDVLSMPIRWNAELRGYVLAPGEEGAAAEVPGLWLTGPELGSLMTLQTCLSALAPEPLGPLIAPIGRRLAAVVARSGIPYQEVQRRVRILPQQGRPVRPDWQTLTDALLTRRRVAFAYASRSRAEETQRTASPQRLVLYRGNWYLDAWCHLRDALRSFAVERIRSPRRCPERARDVDEESLDQALATAYGIFSGAPTDLARLRFSAFAGRWVVDEHWHPKQAVAVLDDGRVEISFPLGRREELVLDVLRWGPEVEVLAPRDLRDEVARRLEAAARVYRGRGSGSGNEPPPS